MKCGGRLPSFFTAKLQRRLEFLFILLNYDQTENYTLKFEAVCIFLINIKKVQCIFSENNVLLPEDTTFLRYTDGEMEDDFEVIFNNFKSM